MRVLQALTSGGTGGTERMVASLAERLPALGIDVDISVLDSGGPVLDTLSAAGVAVHHLGAERSYVTAVRRMSALFHSRRYAAVHLYGFRMSLVARAAGLSGGPPLIHGIRGLHLGDWEDADSLRTRGAIAIERLWSGGIVRYVANSPGARAFLTTRGLPENKFLVIPNGIDTTFWSPGSTAAREPALLVAVANFRPVKRISLLIDAMAALRETGRRPFRMTLVGEGELRPEIERQVRDRGLGDVVTLTGALARDRVRLLQQSARAAVLTSSWEGMPVSVLEAMACGCPVVGTDVPGINDLVEHERTGLLASSDAAAVAAACARLLDDDTLAGRLGAAAREVAVRRYSLERMASEHATLYRMVGTGQ